VVAEESLCFTGEDDDMPEAAEEEDAVVAEQPSGWKKKKKRAQQQQQQQQQQQTPTTQQPVPSKKKKKKQKKTAKKSWWTQLRVAYERLVASVIRPPRAEYSVDDLGPRLSLRAGGSVAMERFDFEVRNARGEALAASLWRPNVSSPDLVAYLHSNSSCRLAAVRSPVLEVAAAAGCALLVFDFAACGKSQGDYVTLGLREADDVRSVLDFVVREFFGQEAAPKVFLWGRSMGAVSALLYHHQQSRRPGKDDDDGKKKAKRNDARSQVVDDSSDGPAPLDVVGLVLDSPFSSIQQLVEDVRKRALPRTPRCCVSCVVCALRRSTRKRAKADVMSVSAIRAAESASAPALFLAANADALAPPPTHARFLAGVYGADCELIDFDGAHNSPRPKHVYDAVLAFLLYRLDDDHHQTGWGLLSSSPHGRRRLGGGLSSSSSETTTTSPSSAASSRHRLNNKRRHYKKNGNHVAGDAATLLIAKE